MPKLVDRDERRRDVADALFRVAVRDGLQSASLRAVAEESGMNIGSVRHYFDGQPELMRFAMQSMLDRVTARLLARMTEAGDLDALRPMQRQELALDMLCELLPLDDARRAEVIIYLEFIIAARTNPTLDDIARESAVGTRTLVRRILTGRQLPRNGTDLDIETERLAALIDGLSLDAALRPDILSADMCKSVLRAHLATIGTPG